jgi:hypothetical protein
MQQSPQRGLQKGKQIGDEQRRVTRGSDAGCSLRLRPNDAYTPGGRCGRIAAYCFGAVPLDVPFDFAHGTEFAPRAEKPVGPQSGRPSLNALLVSPMYGKA